MLYKTNKFFIAVLFTFFLISCGQEESNTSESQEDTTSTSEETTSPEEETTKENEEQKVTFLDDIVQYDSEKELIEVFGEENVTRGKETGPEGMSEYLVSKIFEGTPNELVITWEDTENFQKMTGVTTYGAVANQWKTKNGLALGMPVSEIVELNGKDISFSGFGWDYAGFVNFQKGSLADESKTYIRVDLSPETYENMPEEYNGLLGDITLSSDAELVKKANPIIVELGISKL